MKPTHLIFVLLCLSTSGFSQQPVAALPLTHENYRGTSTAQTVSGCVFLGLGITAFATASKGNVSFDDLPLLTIGGAAATLVSIPLFIAAGRNRKKARLATALQVEKGALPTRPAFRGASYPTLALKLSW